MAFKFQPGFISQRTAMALNELAQMVEKLEPMLRRKGESGERTQERLVVKITAVSGGAYSGTEQGYTTSGAYEDLTNGRVFSPTDKPIYERNGRTLTSFPFYTDVTLRQLVDGTPTYEFDAGKALQVVEVLAGVDLNPCDKIIVPAGFLSSSSGSTANFPYATNSAGGFMSTATQSFAGVKTFEDPIKTIGSMSGTLASQVLHIGKIDTTQPGLFRGENNGVASQCAELDGSRFILQHRDNVGTPDTGSVLYAIRDTAGTLRDGFTGTSGGGDTIVGGITVAGGTAPAPTAIDGGTWT